MSEQEISALRLSFGRQARMLREKQQLNRDDVGESCHCSGSMIGAVERGERIPDTALIHNLDKALDAKGLLSSVAEYMATEKYRAFFRDYAGLERTCHALNAYAPLLIPGLLQTEAYARATFRAGAPAMSEEEIEREIAARIERQELLKRDNKPYLGFIIEESVLQRPLGGKEVLKEQLLHLLECARLHFVTLQVMPTSREEHAGLNGYMTLVTSREHRQFVYLEYPGGSELVSDKKRVAHYQERYGILRAQALSPSESARFIEKLAGEL
ncbi:helix-turn-helix domain-containing protein [Streptomyces litchfieldiae]|uniref:Helix-turn-helix transcriptional regulator n=1 Tax=Streptomyces litchfieldiae TaxID=3075543 RepID=A0ABU2MJ46_9ACTN|nr:helix-turn-helix transcriptional regulator [Streptomyces sp. DSM 44938]MDT0341621.1 helix-turn-helix transcriptional regulator [Streptomyces sp. DSM 44938]